MDVVKQCISRLLSLERCLGSKVKYKLFDARGLDVGTSHGLQQAAQEISAFLGMSRVTFIVAMVKLKPNVAGHVELQDGQKHVSIEISNELAPFPEAVLATLAHEITHKYLHIHGLHVPDQLENEELTDTAAIFLGLGRLLLNGAYYERITQQYAPQGTCTLTESGAVGYLGKTRMALAYLLTCSMRSIPPPVYESELSLVALQELHLCVEQHGEFLNERLQDFNMLSQAEEQLRQEMQPHRRLLAQVDRDLRELQARYFHVIDMHSKKVHRRVHALLGEMKSVQKRGEPDPCVRYLELLRLKRDAKALLLDQVWPQLRAVQHLVARIAATTETMDIGLSFPEVKVSEVVCPLDGTHVGVSSTPGSRTFRCPTCHYEFVVETGGEKPEARPAASPGHGSRNSILQRLKNSICNLVQRASRSC